MSKDTAAFCASEYLNNKNSITRKISWTPMIVFYVLCLLS